MRYVELQDLVESTSPHDWVEVGGSGPSYRNQWLVSAGAKDEPLELDMDTHRQIYVYREDVDITIAYGMQSDFHGSFDRHGRGYSFDWAKKMPDSEVRGYYADLFYRGSLMRREIVLDVDGSRGNLPFPATRRRDSGSGTRPTSIEADYYYAVTESRVAFARLIDRLQGNKEFGYYLTTAGFTVEPE